MPCATDIERWLILIRRYLAAGMMADGLVQPRTEGTPQGGPLSPAAVQHPVDRSRSGTGTTRLCVLPLRGREPKLRIAASSLERLTAKVNALLRGARGRSLALRSRPSTPLLRGWAAYFKLTQTKRTLEERDGWLRRGRRQLSWPVDDNYLGR